MELAMEAVEELDDRRRQEQRVVIPLQVNVQLPRMEWDFQSGGDVEAAIQIANDGIGIGGRPRLPSNSTAHERPVDLAAGLAQAAQRGGYLIHQVTGRES
jgi:hypothetical protein